MRTSPVTILVAVTSVVYVVTACRHVLGGDNAEFALSSATGALVHPPGYPLYAAWLRALRFLPGSSPAHVASLATAIVGIAGVAVASAVARAWGASVHGALVAASLFAFAPLTWAYATSAEVFVPNAVLALGVTWAAAPGARVRGPMRAATLACLLALGACNHHSLALVAPVALYGLWVAVSESTIVVAVRAALVGFAIGLLPLGFLFGGATGTLWERPHDARSLWSYLLRAEYGTFRLSASAEKTSVVEQLVALARSVARAYLFLPLVLALGGFVRGVRSAERSARVGMLALLLAFLLAGPAFVALFNIAPRGIGRAVVERFHLLPIALLVVPVALGFDAFHARFAAGARAWLFPLLVGSIALLANAPRVIELHRPTVDLYLRNTLSSLPPRAVLFASGDHRLFGFAYLQRAVHVREDVTVVTPAQLIRPGYRRRVEASLGTSASSPSEGGGDAAASLPEIVRRLHALGRPVFVSDASVPELTHGQTLVPFGTVYRLLPPGAPPRDPYAVARENEALFATFQIESDRDIDPASWAGEAQMRYASPWLSLADVFARIGDGRVAEICRARARALAPTVVSQGASANSSSTSFSMSPASSGW